MITCRACECKQEPAAKCRRCGKAFISAPVTLKTMAERERDAIAEALAAYRSPRVAAVALGIGQTTIYRKIKLYGLAKSQIGNQKGKIGNKTAITCTETHETGV